MQSWAGTIKSIINMYLFIYLFIFFLSPHQEKSMSFEKKYHDVYKNKT